MNIKKIYTLIISVTFVFYVIGSITISVISIRNAQKEIAIDLSEMISTSAGEMIADSLKLGSFVEARSRIKTFIDNGVFACAELNYEEMPISKCDLNKENLMSFSVELKINNSLKNPILTTYIDKKKITKFAIMKNLLILIFIISSGFLFLILLLYSLRQIFNEIQNLVNEINFEKTVKNNKSYISEINILREKMNQYVSLKQREAHSLALLQTSKQVSHDIRSPLSALNIVLSLLNDLPDDKRLLIKAATQRINDIANDLLQKSFTINDSQTIQHLALENVLIVSTIDCIVSEKRIQYSEYTKLEIEFNANQCFGIFANINQSEIKRVISNLINNSIESFTDFSGKIKIELSLNIANQTIIISITDNGRGISPNILDKLGHEMVSYGKQGTTSGNGMGIFHAREILEKHCGHLIIKSIINIGTTINLILPISKQSCWFPNSINLKNKKYFITVDDDQSIHQIWSDRLSKFERSLVEHIQFKSISELSRFIKNNSSIVNESFFLIDYEFKNQNITGLDIILNTSLIKNSILVTSHYDELSIQKVCSDFGIYLLPKSNIGQIPILI